MLVPKSTFLAETLISTTGLTFTLESSVFTGLVVLLNLKVLVAIVLEVRLRGVLAKFVVRVGRLHPVGPLEQNLLPSFSLRRVDGFL